MSARQRIRAGGVVVIALMAVATGPGASESGGGTGTQPVRVSSDLLAKVAGAQPRTQAEPYLHVDPEDPDHLVAGWQENRYETGSAQAHVAAVSFDGGRKWKETVLPGLTREAGRVGPWGRVADPWVEFGPDGTAFFASLVGNASAPFSTAIVVNRSGDGGSNWGPPVLVTESVDPDYNDKPALTVDTIDGSKYRGNVYVAWDVNVLSADASSFERQDIYVARSTDGGASYEPPRLVRSGPIGGGAIPRVGRKGRVYLLFTAEGSASRYAIYIAESRNGGRNWKRARKVADIFGASVDGLRDGFSLPSFALDPGSGRLYATWQDSRSGVPRILLSTSSNSGKRWSDPMDVVDAPPTVTAFTPSIALNAAGAVGISYYSLDNPAANGTHHYVRVSDNAGKTFAGAVRMTRQAFDVTKAAANTRGAFLGDYAGLAGAGDFFQALWISTRTAATSDVWTARTR